ncbi:MAG: ATP-binding protein [Micromonosporaceae bacterium]
MTSAEEPTVNVKFCLAFPREAVSVPVMRRVLGDTLRNLGVVDECVGDILVAVTEACTNVLRHGGTARRYEVVTSVGASGCVVEVLDSGQRAGQAERPRPGVQERSAAKDHAAGNDRSARRGPAATAASRSRGSAAAQRRRLDQIIARLPESGRGLQIMRALVDDVTLESGPGLGTVVSMRKRVSWRRDAPLTGLSGTELRNAG